MWSLLSHIEFFYAITHETFWKFPSHAFQDWVQYPNVYRFFRHDGVNNK